MHTLPDSRLREPKGGVMVEWPLPDGGSVRCEAAPVFCANCGLHYGYVPRETTVFAFYLCRQCYEDYGDVPGTYAVPEDEFNKAVSYEMRERFGRDLSEAELLRKIEANELGTALELLSREGPYPVRK